ncbi:MAG: hypothetical protein Q7U54_12455 [Bacteroidales bacterium]|nr:hypothetical protein [Bacteroidales bacterium]
MPDFTIKTYTSLLSVLRERGYVFQTFAEFLKTPADKAIVLRHDVDARKENSLRFARIQHSRGIVGSYYFRTVPQSYDFDIINEISALGHEIGYHYETMDFESEKLRVKSEKWSAENLIDAAYEEFCRNLEMFRKIVPVETICMHGSPRSKYDNKDIWKKYDYKKLGLIGEPYFDIDFSKVAYLTDTGRRWNGDKVSVRDKVVSPFSFNFMSTSDIIKNINLLPNQVMFTFHPQRWHDGMYEWTKEIMLQNLKNQIKYLLIKIKK